MGLHRWVVTELGDVKQKNHISIPERGKRYISSKSVQTGCGVHLASYSQSYVAGE